MKRMLLYIDACVWIDFHQNGDDRIRPLKEFSFEMFRKGWGCEFDVVLSDWLRAEILQHLSQAEFSLVLQKFSEQGKVHEVNEQAGDRQKARTFGTHWQDSLHALLAHRAGADYLVTRDVKGFVGCEKYVQVVLPNFV